MQKNILEIVTEALSILTKYRDPASAQFAARNPLDLPVTSARHRQDAEGRRVFNSMLDGWRSALYDVELKLTGKSRYKLTPDNTLIDLCAAYDHPAPKADIVARFLRDAFHDESIRRDTKLSHILNK